jgi:AcrR family transcriptional regulator
MPKRFSENERAIIRQRLMDVAEACLAQYGVRKTSVDEITRRANIPKGTFYLFYDTKELLFFEVFCRFHDRMHQQLLAQVGRMPADIDVQTLTELIYALYKMTKESFMLTFLANGEMELLLRKLPPEVALAHTEKDNFDVQELLALASGLKVKNSRALSGALRAVFMVMLHEKEIGKDIFDDAMRILIRGVAMQMWEEDV